jgi:low temperature requirement protein LtrA
MTDRRADRTGPPAAQAFVPPAPDQSWLELFYDLVFVASIVVLSSAYSNDTTAEGVVWMILLFSMLWGTWLSTTLLLDRVTLSGPWLRTLMIVQMVLVLGMAITSDTTHGDYSDAVGPIFAAVLVTVALQYRSVLKHHPELRPAFHRRATRCLLAAGIFLLTPLFGEIWYIAPWIAAILLFVMPSRHADDAGLDEHHLIHRFGEFTIIMLGEAFVKIGLVATHEPLDEIDFIGLPLTFVLIFAIWWLYFADIPTSGLPGTAGKRGGWIYAHFPFHLCITAVAVSMSRILPPVAEAADKRSVRYIVLPLTIIALSLAVMNRMIDTPLARRRARIHLWSAVALVIAWVVLIGVDSFDLESTAIVVTIVFAVSAWRIRRIRIPAPAG